MPTWTQLITGQQLDESDNLEEPMHTTHCKSMAGREHLTWHIHRTGTPNAMNTQKVFSCKLKYAQQAMLAIPHQEHIDNGLHIYVTGGTHNHSQYLAELVLRCGLHLTAQNRMSLQISAFQARLHSWAQNGDITNAKCHSKSLHFKQGSIHGLKTVTSRML